VTLHVCNLNLGGLDKVSWKEWKLKRLRFRRIVSYKAVVVIYGTDDETGRKYLLNTVEQLCQGFKNVVFQLRYRIVYDIA